MWRTAERKPMLLFEFERGLFKFNANTPAFDVLFQLPPRYGKRSQIWHDPQYVFYLFVALIHPPNILPNSSNFLDQFSYFLNGKNPNPLLNLIKYLKFSISISISCSVVFLKYRLLARMIIFNNSYILFFMSAASVNLSLFGKCRNAV